MTFISRNLTEVSKVRNKGDSTVIENVASIPGAVHRDHLMITGFYLYRRESQKAAC